MGMLNNVRQKLSEMLSLGEDMAPEQDTIAAIEDGVEFRGAKLWILVLAIFVASLGLNTNSAAVIIGAMLISPLMGPIIGMGLGIGINNFMLFKRAAKNYLVATLFSVATATVYFMLTPFNEAQSELLARTSPTIYDVGIALCGGLAGIIALSSRSQRSGNVIPGVAIATALMPPLCTVGFGLGTGNWLFAIGALYLYLINTIFISLATFIGVTLIMRFPKKVFVDKAREKRVKHILSLISVVAIIPSIFITFRMLQETVFEDRCQDFCKDAICVDEAKVISRDFDYTNKVIRVALLGEEVDSSRISAMEAQLTVYGLEDVRLEIVQGASGLDVESVRGMINKENSKNMLTQKHLAESEHKVKLLRDSIDAYVQSNRISAILLPELRTLYPGVVSVSTGEGINTYMADSVMLDSAVFVVDVVIDKRLRADDEKRMESWLRARLAREDARITIVQPRR